MQVKMELSLRLLVVILSHLYAEQRVKQAIHLWSCQLAIDCDDGVAQGVQRGK